MSVKRCLREWRDRFDRAQAYTTTAGHNGWTSKATGTTPTHLNTAAGAKLTLTSTSEAQMATLYQNDVLPFPIDKIQKVEIVALVAGIDAVTTLVMGIASEQNATADSVAEHAWFRMEGSASLTAVVVETDDGTVDNNDVATGSTLAAVAKKFVIDFERGLTDVRFYIDGERVAAGTTFDLSAAGSHGMQPFVQIQKASGTGVPSVTIREFNIVYQTADGA